MTRAKTRANSGKESTPPAGPVTVRRVAPTKKAAAKKQSSPTTIAFSEAPVDPGPTVSGWTQEQARDLLWQGYSHEQVARRTGYPLPWVLKQAVPNCSLQDKIAGRT